jgi:hypothetical protein
MSETRRVGTEATSEPKQRRDLRDRPPVPRFDPYFPVRHQATGAPHQARVHVPFRVYDR